MKKKMPGKAAYRGLNVWLVLVLAAFLFMPLPVAGGQKKGKTPPQKVADTLILVSTFAETGQTLRGARVRLYPADAEGNIVKGKALEGQTNHVGEYPFHVPKTEGTYVLVAEMKGFTRTEKSVKVQGEDQLDVFLQLPAK
ncbi:MAG: hypothetical protein KIT83_17925 [Bryobacterales bacterium]|nr:hypothetical protein [Bryobacterales bacterium]